MLTVRYNCKTDVLIAGRNVEYLSDSNYSILAKCCDQSLNSIAARNWISMFDLAISSKTQIG